HRRELLAAEVEPRRRLPLAGEGLGVLDQPPVEAQVGRALELGHAARQRYSERAAAAMRNDLDQDERGGTTRGRRLRARTCEPRVVRRQRRRGRLAAPRRVLRALRLREL